MSTQSQKRSARPAWLRPLLAVLLAFLAAALVVIVAIAIGPQGQSANTQAYALAHNPEIDPGTSLRGRPAPGFTLTDQFGRPLSLGSLRGHVVILSFDDAVCTTICPLTSAAMVQAKALLGRAGSSVELLGVNANPKATAVHWVRSYSETHGLLHQWRFLTGSLPALRRVWAAYHIEAQVVAGQVDHTPAVFVIDSRGRLAELYQTYMAYASVPQQAQILAHELSSLLPGRPPVHSRLSYQQIRGISPATRMLAPRAGGGRIALGPDGAPRLYVFFATWLTETTDLPRELEALRAYQAIAKARGLPRLTAVDEGSVEPSPRALPRFLASLTRPLPYPVAIDRSGRIADGYLVQDQPWFALVSRSGQTLWYHDASTSGWPSVPALVEHVTAALSAPRHVRLPSAAQAPRVLAGSPPPLARIHRQAGRLLGSEAALAARIRSLRGYPIVIDVWASWCSACQAEYPLMAQAAVRYGRTVAFLGLDAEDYGPSYARAFLARHPLSYPSYQSPSGAVPGSAGVYGLPDTIFIDRRGRVVSRTAGQYDSQGALDGDIQTYALGR